MSAMRLLVTGAAGMLGRDVVTAAGDAGHQVAALARADLDITDAAAVRAAILAARPEAVINCAAWTDVDGAEADEEDATAVNGAGAGNVAAAAAEAGARLVHVSTDYVFDGEASNPYTEDDAARPAVGLRALEARRRARRGRRPLRRRDRPRLLAVRPARRQLRRHHAAPRRRARRDRRGRRPGRLPDLHRPPRARPRRHRRTRADRRAARRRRRPLLVARARRGHLRRGGADLHGPPQSTAALGRPAPRPAFSALASTRGDAPVLPPWREGLRAHLARVEVTA